MPRRCWLRARPWRGTSWVGLLAFALAAARGSAQVPLPGLEQITVTAQLREQPLEDVPGAVTVVSRELLQTRRLLAYPDLAPLTPGMTSAPDLPFLDLTTLRGVGTARSGFGVAPALALFSNGLYQGRGAAQQSALYDLDRVEVARGPQAVLFGHDALGGAIDVRTTKPLLERRFEAGVSYGERSLLQLDLVGNTRVAERLAVRGALHVENQDGFLENETRGETLGERLVAAGRVSATYFGASVEATLVLSYEDREQAPDVFRASGRGLPDYHVLSEQPAHALRSDASAFTASSEVDWEIDSAWTLTSLTGFRDGDFDYAADADGLGASFQSSPRALEQSDTLFQQELRLAYSSPREATLVLGASVIDERLDGALRNTSDFGFVSGGLASSFSGERLRERADYTGDDFGWSLFLDASQRAGSFELAEGVRYSAMRRRLAIRVPDPAGLAANAGSPNACACYTFGFYTSRAVESRQTSDDASFRAALRYEWSDAVSLYAAWAQGFRAGGVDDFAVDVAPADVPELHTGTLDLAAAGGELDRFGSEHSDSVELGLKATPLGGRLRLDAASYFARYQDLQLPRTEQGLLQIENVARARGAGLELESALAAFPWLALRANLAWAWSEVVRDRSDPAEEGRALPRAPELSAGFSVEAVRRATRGGELYLGAIYTYQGDFRAARGTTERVAAYDLLDFRAGYRDRESFRIELFIDNVLDAFEANALAPARDFVAPLTTRSAFGPPRTFGVSATVDW